MRLSLRLLFLHNLLDSSFKFVKQATHLTEDFLKKRPSKKSLICREGKAIPTLASCKESPGKDETNICVLQGKAMESNITTDNTF